MMLGTGWISGLLETPDLRHASDAHLRAAGERIGSHPGEGGIAREPWVTAQYDRESCTAELGVRMVYALNGVKCSGQVPWWAARLWDSPGKLANTGVTMQAFLDAMEAHGACPLDVYDPGRYEINDEPPALARIAAQACNLDLVELYATGADAVLGIVDALAQGLPCGIAIHADDAYRHPVDGIVGPPSGGGGGHAVPIWRYRMLASGAYEFLSPGSWGESFGVDGCVWLHQSRVETAMWAGFARSCS